MACANANAPHTNGAQFFFTLDRCDHLDRKNTIFGRITGESIYNAMSFGELEARCPFTAPTQFAWCLDMLGCSARALAPWSFAFNPQLEMEGRGRLHRPSSGCAVCCVLCPAM